MSLPEGVLLSQGSPLLDALQRLARDARCVFFAGLPGTGKSLLIHQLAHLAHARGRDVHLLQWDIARPAFEASPAGRRYPQTQGITHGLIRIALAASTTRFVIPVPSVALRQHLESERARRAATPVHAREREDAPPDVLRGVWRELVEAATTLGIGGAAAVTSYEPAIYRAVYERLLAHRHAQALAVDERLPAAGVSAYAFRIPIVDLVPSDEEAARFVADAEREYGDPAALERAIAGWFKA
ncbi:MAG: hypothetical protein DMD85_23500 [Candidatus Rokuibacteriota bacterium]|nr:MAG: hypothetical protein DMD85_23500 [Candidatus Rokubacteria bacterium]